MNAISLIDLAALAGSLTAIVFLLLGRKRALSRALWVLFFTILALTALHDVDNFLEWGGITPVLDPLADRLEVLTVVLWGFFFYTYLQRLTEQALRRSEEKYRRLFDLGCDIILAYEVGENGEPGRLIEVNEVACSRLEYTKEELLSMSLKDLYDPEQALDVGYTMETLVRNKRAVFGRVLLSREGKKLPVEISARLFDLSGKRVILSCARDISKRIESEQIIRELRDLDEKILSASPVAFILHDKEKRIIRVSRAYQDVTGFIPDQILGKKPEEFMPEGSQKRKILGNIQKAMEYGVQVGPNEIESPIPGRFLKETIIPIFGPEGKVANILSILEDITRQKEEIRERIKSEQKYRILFENIQDGVALQRMGEDGKPEKFLQANPAFHALCGYAKEELQELSPIDISDEAKRTDQQEIESAFKKGKTACFERVLYTKSGNELLCELRTDLVDLGDEKVFLSICHDVTQRVLAEKRIRTSLKEKEVLLREIHHRVKNNLQVISGLLNLQSYFINDEAVRTVYRESQNRIKTMAMIHEELYQREDLSSVNLNNYLGDLAQSLLASYLVEKDQVQLVLDLEEVDVVLDTAVPCGLIVNELMSNSLKHGFPDGRKGQIEIAFKRSGANRFSLSLSDNGIGLPDDFDLHSAKTMGIQLVRVLSEQLSGNLQYFSEGGTSFLVEFSEYREAETLVSSAPGSSS